MHKVLQVSLLFIFNMIMLQIFHLIAKADILWAVGCGALTGSSCIVFARPSMVGEYPFGLILSYILAMICGAGMHFCAYFFGAGMSFYTISFFAALSVCLTLFLMMLFKIEHPPALGMALILVVDVSDYHLLIAIVCAVALLALLHLLFSHRLKDLY